MGLDTTLQGIADRVDAVLKDQMERHQDRVAQYAQANHVFRNRTGTLQASIAGGTVTGGLVTGKIEGVVEASAEYTSYVINKTGDDFLQRAADATAVQLEAAMASAVADAIEDALNVEGGAPDGVSM